MVKFFLNIYDRLSGRRWVMYIVLALIVAGCAVAASTLRFSEDISGFLPNDKENERINYAYSHIGVANKIVINISAAQSVPADESRELMMDAVDDLARRLSQGEASEHINGLLYKIDQRQILSLSAFVTENMPYYLQEEDYVRIDSALSADHIARRLDNIKGLLLSPAGSVMKQTLVQDPLMFSGRLLSGLQGFSLGNQFGIIDDYIFSADGSEAVITVDSKYPVSETAGGAMLIAAIDRAIEETTAEFGNRITAVPFGSSYIAAANASQIKADSIVSIALAVVLILALLIYFFRDARSIALVGASILFGMLFALGALALLTDYISLIAIGAGSIIIGIAANYPLHFLTHVKDGYSPRQSLTDIVPPLTTGNITTVAAFLSLLFLTSPAMRDLGLFASLLLIGTIVFVLVFVPHMVGKGKQKKVRGMAFGRLANSHPERNKYVVAGLLVITLVLGFFSGRSGFDVNMQNINYMTDDQRARMGKMLELTQGSAHLMYFVAEGEDMEAALQAYEETTEKMKEAVEDGGMISGISGIGDYLPSMKVQEERLSRWNDFWKERKDEFLDTLEDESRKAGFRAGTFDRFAEIISGEYEPQGTDHFEPIISAMAGNYIGGGHNRSMVFTLLHTTPGQAQVIEERLNGIDDRAFAFDAGSITRKMLGSLSADFDYVLYICGFIVFLFLTLSFGRLELSLISFLPLVVSWIWILGIMGLFGMKFNIVNIILATFIFGMGDDYTIFMTEGMMYENAYGRKMLDKYKNTVALSAMIMFVGIGSLIIAKHPAMRSLAEVTIIGMVSVVLTAYVIPPFFFRWLTTRKGKRREEPVTITNLGLTVYSFIVFLTGALVLTLAGFFLLTIGGRSEKNKLRYHRCLQFTGRFVVRHIPRAPFTYINGSGEDFSKPAVIISNHQSHLDLMAILMLTPKLVIVTNKWAWQTPFYRTLIRYADFMPMETLLTENYGKLKGLVAQGYSVMIFPEGTRSADCSIGRFHKGAFFLAEQLGLDIVPVMLHGFGYVLPKTDMLLRKGALTLKVMDRIAVESMEYGEGYSQRAKLIRRMYLREYEMLRIEKETAGFYSNRVLHNYLYKGAPVERRARRTLRLPGLEDAVSQIPDQGKVLIIDPGQGEFALLAALVKKNASFTAVIEDADIRALAANCASVPDNLSYVGNTPVAEGYDATITFEKMEDRVAITIR